MGKKSKKGVSRAGKSARPKAGQGRNSQSKAKGATGETGSLASSCSKENMPNLSMDSSVMSAGSLNDPTKAHKTNSAPPSTLITPWTAQEYQTIISSLLPSHSPNIYHQNNNNNNDNTLAILPTLHSPTACPTTAAEKDEDLTPLKKNTSPSLQDPKSLLKPTHDHEKGDDPLALEKPANVEPQGVELLPITDKCPEENLGPTPLEAVDDHPPAQTISFDSPTLVEPPTSTLVHDPPEHAQVFMEEVEKLHPAQRGSMMVATSPGDTKEKVETKDMAALLSATESPATPAAATPEPAVEAEQPNVEEENSAKDQPPVVWDTCLRATLQQEPKDPEQPEQPEPQEDAPEGPAVLDVTFLSEDELVDFDRPVTLVPTETDQAVTVLPTAETDHLVAPREQQFIPTFNQPIPALDQPSAEEAAMAQKDCCKVM